MNDVNPIYYNTFGVAFQWKRNTVKNIKKVQLVFRDTGLLLSYEELNQFSKNIKCTKDSSSLCSDCAENDACKALLLDSPSPQVSFAMNMGELEAIQDLVEGTLFQLSLDNYLNDVFK